MQSDIIAHQAVLYQLPRDPQPSSQDLTFYINESEFSTSNERAKRVWAQIRWKTNARKAHPDWFLVPFTSWIRKPFPDASTDYTMYLSGKLWQVIRAKVFSRYSGRCECCGKTATEVHHRDYRPRVLKGDDLLPLVSVCRACHRFIHKDPVTGEERDTWQNEEATLAAIYDRGIPTFQRQ